MLITSLLVTQKVWTLEEYFEFEEKAKERHEFHAGKLHAMSGGTLNHSRICIMLSYLLNGFCLANSEEIEVLSSDMRVLSVTLDRVFYPDISIVKGKPHSSSNNNTVFENPCCIIEVLSNSTSRYDMGEKFNYYKTLSSFREYVLIDQYQKMIEVRTLKDVERNLWSVSFFTADDDTVRLESIGFETTVKEIYQRVIFEEEKK